ncbi:hypothetical protein, partial [Paracidovorax anthurii]
VQTEPTAVPEKKAEVQTEPTAVPEKKAEVQTEPTAVPEKKAEVQTEPTAVPEKKAEVHAESDSKVPADESGPKSPTDIATDSKAKPGDDEKKLDNGQGPHQAEAATQADAATQDAIKTQEQQMANQNALTEATMRSQMMAAINDFLTKSYESVAKWIAKLAKSVADLVN